MNWDFGASWSRQNWVRPKIQLVANAHARHHQLPYSFGGGISERLNVNLALEVSKTTICLRTTPKSILPYKIGITVLFRFNMSFFLACHKAAGADPSMTSYPKELGTRSQRRDSGAVPHGACSYENSGPLT